MKHHKKNNYIIYGGIAVVLVAVLGYWLIIKPNNNALPGQYDTFAKCLAESGAKMYGAWWCPHCQDQKKEFGSSWKMLEEEGGYIECSTSDQQQTQVCKDAGIQSYPTWRFRDGSEEGGKLSFTELSAKSGCPLP